ncbi:hypothetical protein SVIOM342S_03175 [Streptomyces violaceorubidus]
MYVLSPNTCFHRFLETSDMVASHWVAASAQTPSRRRGAVLERAILEAALDQLGTVGWNGLTMEGVAAGAQTGKAAVYRRWPSKEDLVADALRSGLPDFDTVPTSEACARICWNSAAGRATRCTAAPGSPCVP